MNPISSIISAIFEAATFNGSWMLWNTFLALIPLGLAYCLFRSDSRRTVFWWVGLATFVAFLPNAPYVLTDIIHLVYDIRKGYSIWIISLVLVPQYLLFMALGFEAYVLSVLAFVRYLKRQRWPVGRAVEFLIHALCAIGIYLGRFRRFNSWDILTRPDAVFSTTIDHLQSDLPLLIIVITFGVLALLYWISKHLTLALAWYWPRRHQLFQEN